MDAVAKAVRVTLVEVEDGLWVALRLGEAVAVVATGGTAEACAERVKEELNAHR